MDAPLKMILIKLSFYLKNKSILFLIFLFFFFSTGINIYDLNVTSILSIEVSNIIQNFNIENNKDLLYDYYTLNKIDSTLLLIYFISCYCFVPCFIIAPFF